MRNNLDNWILLVDARKKLLSLWLIFTAVLVSFFLFMTVNTTFEGVEITAWIWLFIGLLPMLILLFADVIRHKQQSKVIQQSTFQLVYRLAFGYLILTLLTFFGLQAWLDSHLDAGIGEYFQLSYLWLLPFQVLLLYFVRKLYFQPPPLLQSNPENLLTYTQKKVEYAQRTGNLVQEEALNLLTENNLPPLFDRLKTHFAKQPEYKEILLLESSYNTQKTAQNLDVQDPAFVQRALNKIKLALIDYIEKIK